MTDRSDLTPDGRGFRRVSYTCRYGFVDWGHASPGRPSDPNSLAALHRQLTTERGLGRGVDALDLRLNGRPAYLITYGMGMGKRVLGLKVGMSTMGHWIVQRGLATRQREAVAIGMLQAAALQFEIIQEKLGLSDRQLRPMLGEIDMASSTAVWDRYLGAGGLGGVKNRTFTPRLFPCDACRHKDTSLPALLANAEAAREGDKWVRVTGRDIDATLLTARVPLDVDNRGTVRFGKR